MLQGCAVSEDSREEEQAHFGPLHPGEGAALTCHLHSVGSSGIRVLIPTSQQPPATVGTPLKRV